MTEQLRAVLEKLKADVAAGNVRPLKTMNLPPHYLWLGRRYTYAKAAEDGGAVDRAFLPDVVYDRLEGEYSKDPITARVYRGPCAREEALADVIAAIGKVEGEGPGMRKDESAWIQTFTGRKFWPLEPRAEDIFIEDVAHALALKCRFAGHCREFYSVAEHCVRGSYQVPEGRALEFLLHDAAEAYLFDACRPIKALRPQIKEDEERLMRCVRERFGLSPTEPAEVKMVDLRMLLTEARDVMAPPPEPWQTYGLEPYPLPYRIEPWGWREVEERFLSRFVELTSSLG